MQLAVTLSRVRRNIIEASVGRQFFRNVAVVLTGAALSQVIGIAVSPIVSRLFSPEAFGVLGSFMSLLGLVGPAVTLAYAGAIVLPRREEESAAVIWLSITVSAGISILSILAVVIYDVYGTRGWSGDVQNLLYVVPVVIMFEALLQVTQQCMIREKRFRQTAQFNIIQAIVSAAAKIVAGLVSPSAFSLVLVSLIAVPINAIFYAVALNKNRSGSRWPPAAKFGDIRAAARRYIDFPLYRTPQSLVSAASLSLPILILAYYHGPAAAGFFTLSNSMLGAPMQLMTKAINDVFFPRLVDASHRREETRILILKAAWALAAVSVVPLLLLFLAGPWLFQLVFGAKWLEAGEYARWLALLTCTTLVLRSALSAAPVLKVQGTYLVFEIVGTLFKLAALSIAALGEFQPVVPVALYSIIGSIANAVFFWYIVTKAGQFDDNNVVRATP
ncbi:oligosaccharide flippase family protein [Bradyrhizobium sp. USDA 4486]